MDVVKRLYELQDIEYKQFHSKLIPNICDESIIGVRIPLLRKLAKELYSSPVKQEFMNTLPHNYYEENQLHIMMICMEKDFNICIEQLNRFLPYADNWAVTDQPSPKCFKSEHKKLIPIVKEWLNEEHVYTARYAINIFMREFLEEDFNVEYADLICKKISTEYYLNMMRAWYFATALVKQYDLIIPFIEEKKLDVWTHNKTIQKAIESYRITKEQKTYLKTLKIKA